MSECKLCGTDNDLAEEEFERLNTDIARLKEQNAKLVKALSDVRAKVNSATFCHEQAVQYLLSEALEIIDSTMLSAAPYAESKP